MFKALDIIFLQTDAASVDTLSVMVMTDVLSSLHLHCNNIRD